MTNTAQSQSPAISVRSNSSDDIHDTSRGSNHAKSNSELKLWPPRLAQAYCRDHFLMEAEIYYGQENDKYRKLVRQARKKFLTKQAKHCEAPPKITRRQPSRKAKTVLASSETRPKASAKTRDPGIAPFRPARIERAFHESPEGRTIQLLTMCHKKYSFHQTWTQFRSNVASSIDEIVKELQATKQEGIEPELCIFNGPISAQCRYCEDDSVSGPSKRTALEQKYKATRIKEEWIDMSGMRIIIDICDEDTKILIVHLKGLLESCAELFDELDLPLKLPEQSDNRCLPG
ncbi:hypothetical protein F5Y18DRAFT_248079 [Xylariaceae sp. FL1019]|nr:hypothetical protein F5Y18DRAFT_248079 [Xylariaceae sp. FL1019]